MAISDDLFPNIQFEEIITSPRPIQVGSTNRIGIIGTFRKGAAGTFRLMSSFEQLRQIFGETLHQGSIGVQAAMEQGADDFGNIRVLGVARKATRNIVFGVTTTDAVAATQTVTIAGTIHTGDIVTVTVNGTAISFTITGSETTATLVAVAVKNALNANGTVAALVTATNSSGVITLTAVTAGTAGNAITVEAEVTGGGATTTATAGGATLSGGAAATTTVGEGDIEITVAQYEDDNTTLTHTTTATLAVTNGQTAAAIANAAVSLINSTGVMEDDVAAVYDTGGTVTLQAKTAGNLGNFLKVTVTIPGSGGASNVTVSPGTATNFTGGADGPAKAELMVQDDESSPADLLRFVAVSEGLSGEEILITTSPGSAAGRTNILVSDSGGSSDEEEVYLDVEIGDAFTDPETAELLVFRNSNLVRVFVEGTNTRTPAIVTAAPLEGGSDGPSIEVEDYIDALTTMEENVVNFLLAPGRTETAIRSALIAQAERSDAMNGYRIAILNADKAMALEGLDTVTQAFNTNTGSAVMVAGWGSLARQPRLSKFGCSPDAVYAGHLAVTPPQVSPAARSRSPFIRGITEVDTRFGRQAFNAYTKARMEALVVDPATGGIHCLNGRTLSSDPAWYWVSIRRVTNLIKADLFRMVQWVKSEPNTPALRLQLAQQLDQYMEYLLSRGIIAATQKSKVDASNNPPGRVASGFLRAEVYYMPVFPADKVQIGVRRFLSADVSVEAS